MTGPGPSRYAIARDVLENLPATVRATRRRAGLTGRAAARAIGIGTSTLYGLESNSRRHTDIETVIKVLVFLQAHESSGAGYSDTCRCDSSPPD